MKNIILLALAMAMAFGCVQETGGTAAAPQTTDGMPENVSQPAANESIGAATPENETAAPAEPAERGNVTLEVNFTEVELETSTQELRKPNPSCYPDAEKCAMMDEEMHIFEYVEHEYYDLSSGTDTCILSIGDKENDALFLVEYTLENQDSLQHTVSPELLVKTGNAKVGYLVSTPRSEKNCTGFYDGSDLDIVLEPSESMDFKAVIVIPEGESPLSASVYVDGKAG